VNKIKSTEAMLIHLFLLYLTLNRCGCGLLFNFVSWYVLL